MSIELNPADVRRGVVPQLERPTGQKRLREPKRVKLEYRHFEGEEWQTWRKYHTRDEALKARKSVSNQYPRFAASTGTTWRVDGEPV